MKLNILDIIDHKKQSKTLTKSEIEYVVNGYVENSIPDYQMAAFLMAIYFRGMNSQETHFLTDVMKNSGDVIKLNSINGIKVDKHSTGGVGDKTSLIALPIAAALGVKIPKMSGRGLGFTGGTIDKLESIPGYNIQIDKNQFINTVNKVGLSIIGQSDKIATADKLIYSLRSNINAVDSLPLIVSSIMSKKLASGCNGLVLEVTYGSGAFMQTKKEAMRLADEMEEIGAKSGIITKSILTSMDEPLGYTVGNALEVIEALEILKAKTNSGYLEVDIDDNLIDISLEIAANMALISGKINNVSDGLKKGRESIKNHEAYKILCEMVKSHGGKIKALEDYKLLYNPKYTIELRAASSGTITSFDTKGVGMASCISGAGRVKKEDKIDNNAGIILKYKLGAEVTNGDILAKISGDNKDKLLEARDRLANAIIIK